MPAHGGEQRNERLDGAGGVSHRSCVELTKRQKLCGLVMVMAVGALAVDRLVLGGEGPSAASAAEVEADTPTPEKPAAAVAKPPVASLESRVAAALPPGDEAVPLSRAFSAPTEWLPAGPEGGVEAGTSTPAAGPVLKLSAVGSGFAKVNDVLLQVGQRVGDLTLVEVDATGRRAWVEVNGVRHEVAMPKGQ
jgi:hypothetical protein